MGVRYSGKDSGQGFGILAVGGGSDRDEVDSRLLAMRKRAGGNEWQCEYCDALNADTSRCVECGAPVYLRGRTVHAVYLDDAWDDVEPDPALRSEIEK